MRLPILVTGIISLLAILAACAAPAYTTPAPAPAAAPQAAVPQYTIELQNKAGLGDYLTDSSGRTLYYFTKDTNDKSNATPAIVQNWPIFNAGVITVPASLHASDFGTITRDDGTQQTTYKGWPLYYFVKDLGPGDTLGQGVNNVWFVAGPEAQPAPLGAGAQKPMTEVVPKIWTGG